MTADAVVEDGVRELVRRRGLDPMADPTAVRRLVEEVVGDYDERSLASGLAPLSSPAETIRLVVDAVAGFGPLQRYLEDPAVEEIWINEPGRVFVARRGRSELTTTILTAEELHDLVERMLRSSGRRVDVSTPFVDATLPDGSRLHVVIPDITREHLALNIRKFVVPATHLDELVQLGSLTSVAARFLEATVMSGLNILVAGGTQAGKTTLLNCIAAAIPAQDRVVTAEEVFELRIPLPDVVAMQTRQPSLEGTGEVRLRRLIKEALRMRPSRLIVGEVRQEECLDLLIALNSGVPGMATLHANTAREAITKMCTLPLLAGENVTSAFVVPTVAACIDVVVHIRAEREGARRIHEIIGVPGRVEDGNIETERSSYARTADWPVPAAIRRDQNNSPPLASTSASASTPARQPTLRRRWRLRRQRLAVIPPGQLNSPPVGGGAYRPGLTSDTRPERAITSVERTSPATSSSDWTSPGGPDGLAYRFASRPGPVIHLGGQRSGSGAKVDSSVISHVARRADRAIGRPRRYAGAFDRGLSRTRSCHRHVRPCGLPCADNRNRLRRSRYLRADQCAALLMPAAPPRVARELAGGGRQSRLRGKSGSVASRRAGSDRRARTGVAARSVSDLRRQLPSHRPIPGVSGPP